MRTIRSSLLSWMLLASTAALSGCAERRVELRTSLRREAPAAVKSAPNEASLEPTEATNTSRGAPHPATPRRDVVDVIHGVTVHDPYRWLEDLEAPEVQAWLHAEDERARSYLSTLEGVKPTWDRMLELWSSRLPPRSKERGSTHRTSFTETARGIVATANGKERLLVAKETLPDGAWFGALRPSGDDAYLAYEIVSQDRDERTLRVVDVRTGVDADVDEMRGLTDTWPIWRSSPRGFFYAAFPPGVPYETRSAFRVTRFHRLGTPVDEDETIVPASSDPLSDTAIGPRSLLPDGRHLLVVSAARFDGRTYSLVDLSRRPPQVTPLLVPSGSVGRAESSRSSIFANEVRDDGTTSFVRLDPPYTKPRELVEGSVDEPVYGFSLYGDVTLLERPLGPRSRFDVYDGKTVSPLLEQRVGEYVRSIAVDSKTVFFEREGLVRPPERIAVDRATRAETVIAGATPPLDRSRFVVDAFELRSSDGIPIAVTTLRLRDVPPTDKTPLWVDGYGGFSWARPRYFYPGIPTWVERGGVYAYVHLRGGSDYGPRFAVASRRKNRPRVYEDFATAIEALHRRGISSPSHTAIHGHSNGGLLVSVVGVTRPDLVRFVYDEAGLADMVRYPRWGRAGMSEYGDPDDAEEFAALYATSPYHQVRDGVRYPTFFLTIATGDERVTPIHGAKLAAALSQASRGGNVVLKVYWGAGHMGNVHSPSDDPNHSYAEAMAFALSEM